MEIEQISEIILNKFPNGGIIGISGRGAAGKSVLAKELNNQLNNGLGKINCFDEFLKPHYVRYNLNDEENELYTGYHPKSFNYSDAIEHINSVKKEFPSRIKYLIFEGVSAFHYNLLKTYNITIFLNCSDKSERLRRKSRKLDSLRLDYIKNNKMKLYKARKIQFNKYVYSVESLCDISLFSESNYEMKLLRIHSDLVD